MPVQPIDINNIKASVAKSSGIRPTKDFNTFLGAADAMSGTASTAAQLYGGGGTAYASIAAAFSGVDALASLSSPGMAGGYGGGMAPTMAGGYNLGGGVSSPGFMGIGKSSSSYMPSGIPGSDSSASVIPGTEGFSQWDLINTMNSNNLQLLELQATMQSNMQSWNTKSNILSADHRSRMSMIEKFTARA
jgi:hypothetical protein